jgi:DMSO reductase anchor subunit
LFLRGGLLNPAPNARHAELFWLTLVCLFWDTRFHLGELRSFWRHLHRLGHSLLWRCGALGTLYVYRTLN